MTDLPARADYDRSEPFAKGFMAYIFAKWPDSEIPENNPFNLGTIEAEQFADGVNSAILCAQDSEE